MEPSDPTGPPCLAVPGGADRRAFIRNSAIAGGLVWAAPAVLTVARSQAQQPSPPPSCACRSNAYGLRVIIPGLGIDETLGRGGCVADTGTIGAAGVATVAATVVCAGAESQGGVCSANASIATLDVVVGPTPLPTLTVSATMLTSRAGASCDPCGTKGDSTIASLIVNAINVDVSSLTCNNDVLDLGVVVFNEQSCSGDTLGVDALHVNVLGIVEVIAAHSEAGATDCPCRVCA